MPRRDIPPQERNFRGQPVVWDMQRAQYVHPGVATVGGVFPVDSSPRYLAVPPVPNTYGPSLDTENRNRPPDSFEVWRSNNQFYLRLDTSADSQYAAILPPDVLRFYNINPAVKTVSVVAVNGTDPLNFNWLWTL